METVQRDRAPAQGRVPGAAASCDLARIRAYLATPAYRAHDTLVRRVYNRATRIISAVIAEHGKGLPPEQWQHQAHMARVHADPRYLRAQRMMQALPPPPPLRPVVPVALRARRPLGAAPRTRAARRVRRSSTSATAPPSGSADGPDPDPDPDPSRRPREARACAEAFS